MYVLGLVIDKEVQLTYVRKFKKKKMKLLGSFRVV